MAEEYNGYLFGLDNQIVERCAPAARHLVNLKGGYLEGSRDREQEAT